MTDRRHVKIVIPCANEGPWLRATVDSILECTDYPSFDIFISANGDRITDFSFLEQPAYRRQVQLRVSDEFLGVGNGRNVAVTPGDAAFYVFLDAHCLLEQKDWLDRAVACLEEHPEACMVQPEVLSFTYREEIKPGEKPDLSRIQRGFFEYCIRWTWPYDEPWRVTETLTHRQSSAPYEAMSGAGMAIFTRAETFHRLGKFESEVKGWFHETLDYCVRSWMLGHPMLVDPTIRVLHRTKTEKPRYPRWYYHIIHGILRTAYKYLSPRRQEVAETLFREHGLHLEVDEALKNLRQGRWLSERAEHLRQRVHDDDWLFSRFDVYEERFTG
jgi:GT2 family glycosyltransferase